MEEDDEDEEIVKVSFNACQPFKRFKINVALQTIKKQSEMLFVRGKSCY